MEILRTIGIEKSFRGVQALKGVDFEVNSGEIHALMGENGAGKSTLIKIITGVYQPTAGTVCFAGRPCAFQSPLDAERAGVSTVYQEVNLLPDLSVAENICIGREPKNRLGLIDKRAMQARARRALARLEVDINVSESLSSYSIAVQQLVSIARALDVDCRLLILDEPTSSLDDNEVNDLFQVMRKLRQEGMAIIFITHFLEQVYAVSDRITILRDGQKVGTYEASSLSRMDMVAKMLGKTAETVLSPQPVSPKEDIKEFERRELVLDVSGIGHRGLVNPMDVSVHAGEQIGLAGLLGAGRSELAQLLFGVISRDSGVIRMHGKALPARFWNPHKAVKAHMALIAEDRKGTGIIPDLTVRENIMLALQASHGIWKTLNIKQQQELVDKYIKLLGIKTPDAEQLVKNLSGGNQQKVLIARWLATSPDLLILDEPTRGIDVGAKAEIESLTRSLCEQGMAVVFISSELEEVVRDCQRVVVLREHEKIGELNGGDISLQAIMSLIASGNRH